MCKKNVLIGVLLAMAILAASARAATMSASVTAPVVDGEDIASYGTPTGQDKWWPGPADAFGNPGKTVGQTFTTGSEDVLLNAFTFQVREATEPTKEYTIRVGTVSESTFTEIASEPATQSAANAADAYWTWTLDSPVVLLANTLYGVDVGLNSSTSEWTTGIPYVYYTADVYAGGTRFRSGSAGEGVGDTSMTHVSGDRVFHLDLSITGSAGHPSPYDGATDVCRSVVLSWAPGDYADNHDVYFGTNEADVNNANTTVQFGVYRGRQNLDDDTYDPTIDLGGPLEWETTYYWRIDEVNAPPDDTIYKGNIWQFTTEACAFPIPSDKITATAFSSDSGSDPNNTIDLDGDLHSLNILTDVWLSDANSPGEVWIKYEFDKVYKLHEMWVWNYNIKSGPITTKLGFKNVTIEYSTDGSSWTLLAGVPDFNQATGQVDYPHNTTVGFSVAARYVRITALSNWQTGGQQEYFGLSEVRFFAAEAAATEPSPADEATDVPFDVVLSWRAGREADTHNLYLSTDEQAVIGETIDPCTIPAAGGCRASYAPLSLEYDKTYYWRVDEVNMAEAYTTWEGDVWNFTTTTAPQATNPNPTNNATGVDPNADLSWTADPDAESHDVYFGTSSPPPFIHNQSDTTFDPPGTMDYGTTYYWRIDEVGLYGTIIGEVWSFTVINYLVVDDMEDYNDRMSIITVWRDGYTGGSVGKSGSNVTVSTESDNRDPRLAGDGPPWPVRDSEAMQFAYDNDGSITIYVYPLIPYTYSADANYYSEAKAGIANLPIDPNWTEGGVKALSLWFYGDADNDIEPMWVKLTDQGGSSGKVTYGDYDENPNDINDPSWHEWNIPLSDFGVNLADVNNISIGFGDESNNTTPGGSGVVYFDDIRLYSPRCILLLRSPDFARVDYVEDCVVDYKEVKVMAENWLAVVPIQIDNPGFEDPVLAEDDWTWLSVPGWTTTANVGIWNVTTADFTPVVAPEGENVLYSEDIVGGTGGVAQVLTDTFTSNDYTLTVEVGNSYYYYFSGYRIQLLAGGVVIAEDYDTLWPAYYLWATSTVEYTYDPADAALVGQPLEIRLLNLGLDKDNPPAGELVGVEFDDVTLFHSPEPLTEIPRAAERRVNLYEDEKIDFKDFAELAAWWLDEQLFP